MSEAKIELFQIRCFLAVAAELNFRRAAERMNMTQPPLSRQIQQLESRIGFALLERNNRQVRLTSAGKSFLNDSLSILQKTEEAILSAKQAARGERGSIVLGFVPSASLKFIPQICSKFLLNKPLVNFDTVEMMSYEIIEALKAGKIDFGLTRSTSEETELISSNAIREPFILAIHLDHPLNEKETLNIMDIHNEPFVAYSRERGGFLRDMHEKIFSHYGIQPKNIIEVSQTHSVLSLVNNSIGISLVPKSSQVLMMRNLAYREIDLPQEFVSSLNLVHSKFSKNAHLKEYKEIFISALNKD